MHTCLSHMLRMAFRLERGQASAGKAFREGKLDRVLVKEFRTCRVGGGIRRLSSGERNCGPRKVRRQNGYGSGPTRTCRTRLSLGTMGGIPRGKLSARGTLDPARQIRLASSSWVVMEYEIQRQWSRCIVIDVGGTPVDEVMEGAWLLSCGRWRGLCPIRGPKYIGLCLPVFTDRRATTRGFDVGALAGGRSGPRLLREPSQAFPAAPGGSNRTSSSPPPSSPLTRPRQPKSGLTPNNPPNNPPNNTVASRPGPSHLRRLSVTAATPTCRNATRRDGP